MLCVDSPGLGSASVDELLKWNAALLDQACKPIWSMYVKTLDHKDEYALQPWAYVSTWYLFTPLQRVWLRFSEELYQKEEYCNF